MGTKLTPRDVNTLKFIAKWRFCTADHLLRAGIYNSSRKKCVARLSALRKSGYLKSYRLPTGHHFYLVTPKGGEAIGLLDAWHSIRYRPPAVSTIINQLVAVDFALAAGIDQYLSRQVVLDRFLEADYSVLLKILKSTDRFYQKDGVLHALVIDHQLSLKYLAERAKAYSNLPPSVRENLTVVFLVFSETKKAQILNMVAGSKARIKVFKANWKYS